MRPGGIISSVVRNRVLIWEMALRDLKGATRGTVVGHAWVVLSPLIQAAAYVAIVTWVFGARVRPGAGPLDYALYVLGGMAVWQFVARCLQDASTLVRDRMELVKQVIYPLETLAATSMVVNATGPLVVLSLYLVTGAVTGHASATWLLLPVPVALTALFVIGCAWIFSIAGVVLKDLREIVSVILGLLIFMSPVLLSEQMVGQSLWQLVLLNPLSHVIICFRDVLEGQFHALSWALLTAMAGFALFTGAWVIRRTKILINEYI